jgi:hypothetical protein
MNRTIARLTTACLALCLGLSSALSAQSADPAAAQSAAAPAPAQSREALASSQPQIAYRIFSDYVDNKSESDAKGKFGWGMGLTIGGGLALGTAGVFAALDPAVLDPNDTNLKWRVAAITGLSGAVMTGVGIGLLASPVPDYREKYRVVFLERDPLVQEALAASSLKEMAQKGKEGRIASALTTILTPLLFTGIMTAIDVSQNRPWYQSAQTNVWWLAGSAVSGGISLFSTSSEERLYDKYLSARDAMYAIPGGHK